MWQAESDFQLEWTHQHTRLPLNKCAFPFQINSVEVVGLIHKFHSKTHFPFANRFGRIWCGLWKERISWLGFWCSVKGLVERRFMRKMESNSRNQLKHYFKYHRHIKRFPIIINIPPFSYCHSTALAPSNPESLHRCVRPRYHWKSHKCTKCTEKHTFGNVCIPN